MDIKSLIPVNYDNEEITVLGRNLHAALEVETPYTMWFKRMCEYGFEEGVDYIKFYDKNLDLIQNNEKVNLENNQTVENNELESTQPFRIKVPVNHQLKLDMAKEIAMIQRSEVGRKVRKYFIEVEKQYREHSKSFGEIPISHHPKNLALIDAGQRSITLNQYFGVHIGIARVHSINEVEKDYDVDLSDIKRLIPAAEDMPVDYTPTQLAEKLAELTGTQHSAKKINISLAELGYQHKNRGQWVLTETGKRYGTAYPYERNGHTGFQIRWNKSVIEKLIRKNS